MSACLEECRAVSQQILMLRGKHHYQNVPFPPDLGIEDRGFRFSRKKTADLIFDQLKVRGTTLLDMAANFGYMSYRACLAGFNTVIAVEPIDEIVALGTPIAKYWGYAMVKSTIHDFPIKRKYDVVLLFNILHNVPATDVNRFLLRKYADAAGHVLVIEDPVTDRDLGVPFVPKGRKGKMSLPATKKALACLAFEHIQVFKSPEIHERCIIVAKR